jgi:hypothetical protein
MGLIRRILTGYDDDGVSVVSWKEAKGAEARRQEREQALHDPTLCLCGDCTSDARSERKGK